MRGKPPVGAVTPAFRPAVGAICHTGISGGGYESTVSNHHVNMTPQENSLIDEALARVNERLEAVRGEE